MPSMRIAYVDTMPTRREAVKAVLATQPHPWQAVSRFEDVPLDVEVVIVGLSDFSPSLSQLAELASQCPTRQVLMLWEGQDPETMLQAVRAGARDVLTRPEAVAEGLARAEQRLVKAAVPERKGLVIAVFSLKGGIGKSTLAANLAIALHQKSKKPVTAIDLSIPCGNLEMYMDLRPARCVSDVLALGGDLDPQALDQALARHVSGISLLAGPRMGRAAELSQCTSVPMLDLMTRNGEIVVIDVGAFLEEAQVTALERADLVILPVVPLVSSLATVRGTREAMKGLGIAKERVIPVVNHPWPDAEQVPDDVYLKLVGEAPRHKLPWFAGASKALNDGHPVAHHQPRIPLSQAIGSLAASILGRFDMPACEEPEPMPAAPAAHSPITTVMSWFQEKGAALVRP